MSAGKLPEGWVETYLSEICSKPQYGYTTKSSFTGNVKFLRTTDITKGTVDWSTVPYCLQNPDDILKYQLQDRDIVISRAGSVGFSFLVKNPPNNAVFASYLIRFKPFDNISELYLKRFLESGNYWVQLASMSAGNALQNVNAQKLSTLIVPIPPLAEQKIIAEKLDTLLAQVDSTKARLEQIPQILKRFRQAVLVSALSITNEKSPESDNIVKLVEVAEKITDGEHITPKTVEAGIPLLSAKDVQENELLFDNVKYLSKETADKALSRCSPEKDDILIVSRGATVGRTHLVSINTKFFLMGSVLLIKLNKNIVLPSFMKLVFNNISGQKQLVSASGATAQQAIYIRDVKEFKFKLLSIPEQAEIVRRVEQLFAYADTIEKQVNNALARVNNLTQSILAKAFRGELTAQWRAENPDLISGENSAAALLEKIKAERAASGGKKASRKKS
ncbi:restriction endonuclease subunit S [Escherichia coli]|uniref:restriction endonuclease subunit S n=1 Tax=Escherichia coli TaxID=562 RepID=UPI002658C9BD|nr:restriction endonuclease subunit S [Escherichia coli]